MIQQNRIVLFLSFFYIFSLTSDLFAGDAKQAVVVLPPAFPSGASAEIEKEANHVCDLLSEELSKGGTIQVVNRTELKRLLNERKTPKEKQKKIISYSAMIRLEVTTSQEKPISILRLIDLSSGSVLGTATFNGKVLPADIAKMKQLCLSAIKKAGVIEKGKVRIRALGVKDTGKEVRMKPFANKLSVAFNLALGTSKKVMLMQHLEASNSMEESLLLLMGLSQIPGNRQFVPQADATIELRVKEGDGVGKTFQETPIIIGVRLADAKQQNNKWIETTGKVKEFETIIKQAWDKLSKSLDIIEPGSATVVLKEMQLRRKQAEAEYRAAQNVYKKVGGHKVSHHILQAIAHLDTALKIDPTFPDPHLHKARMYFEYAAYCIVYDKSAGRKEREEQAIHQAVIECEKYVLHPHSNPQRWPKALDAAILPMNWFGWVSSNSVIFNRSKIEKIVLTLKNKRTLAALKVLTDHALNPAVKKLPDYTSRAVLVLSRSMRIAGVSLEERTRWLDGVIKSLDYFAANTKGITPFFLSGYLNRIRFTRIAIVQSALEDQQMKRAKRLLRELRKDIKPQNISVTGLRRLLRTGTKKLNDKEELKNFDQWASSLIKSNNLLTITWPQIDVRDSIFRERVVSYKQKKMSIYCLSELRNK